MESYPAGKEIYAKGSLGRSMMAVLRGRAKMASVSRDGKEIVFNIMHPGEIFGEIALLDGGQRSADAIAMTDCEILVLDRRDFMPLLEKRAEQASAGRGSTISISAIRLYRPRPCVDLAMPITDTALMVQGFEPLPQIAR